MPTKIIRNSANVDALADLLRGRKFPITISWIAGASRSNAQNRLSHRWYSDVARQLGDRSTGNVRAECKLRFGVPILRRDNAEFRAAYDAALKPLPYETKMQFIEATEFAVTSIMTTKQMSEYMDAAERHWLGLGLYLTNPESLKYEQEFANNISSMPKTG